MPIKRDKQTKVVRDVPQRTLDRWPDDYVDLTKAQQKALVGLRDAGVRESDLVPALRAALDLAAAGHIDTATAAATTADSIPATEQTDSSAPPTPTEGTEPKERD